MLRRCFTSQRDSFNSVRIVDILSTNIHKNLALENYLFNFEGLKVPTLLFWRNDKTIVIGKHQNPWKECYLDRIERDGVTLARRKSGGGAVYQDLGNSCFSFLIPIYDEGILPLDTRKSNNDIILRTMKGFDIDAKVSGRNDLEVNGKKFSGSAYELDLGGKFSQKKALHHGTILLEVNFGELNNYLNPSKPKLRSKGVDSVVSRVINLKDLNPSLTHQAVGEALKREFKREYDWCQATEETIEEPLAYHPKVGETFQKWTDAKWVIGQTPEFSNNLETRFDWGTVDVFLEVEAGVIVSGKVFSDSLFPGMIDALNDELNSKHYDYSANGFRLLEEILSHRFADNAQVLPMIKDFCNWIIAQI